MNKPFIALSVFVSIVAIPVIGKAADMAPAPSAYDWSGVYLGLNAGVAWSNSEVDSNVNCSSVSPNADWCATRVGGLGDELRYGVDDSGGVFTGGAMIGANWQWESLVLGVEADVNYANFGESSSRDLDLTNFYDFQQGDDFATSHADLDADWWGTVRGRIGFAADNLLFYGTGGLAWGTIDASVRIDYCRVNTCSQYGGSDSSTNVGWTIGAGMEYGMEHWTFGAEYLYVDLGDADFDQKGILLGYQPPAGVTLDGDASVDYQFSVVRATAKWKF